ncbi:MAG TPA: hypothetical protein VGM17_05050 [Rhizomicrobium sp.]
MTDRSTTDLHTDISYMRSLAEQGRRGPILGGAFLAAAGLVFGCAAFVQGAMQAGYLASFPIGDIWIGAGVLFAAIWVALFLRLRGSGEGVRPGTNQYAFGMAWSGAGAGIVVLILAIAIESTRMNAAVMEAANGLVAFAFYGTAWLVSGALARQRWMFVAAAAAFGFTLLLAYLANTPAQVLALGIALILTLTLPGLQLVRQASR